MILALALGHHVAKLLEVNLSISVIIDLGNILFELLSGHCDVFHAFFSEHFKDLKNINFATFILVKHIECGT